MPRKTFVAGEILTAADVNTNLMDQSVMVFDDATDRATAIPTPVEGMVTYLKDTDEVEKFDGDDFVSVSPAPTPDGFTASTTITATDATFSVPALGSPIVKVTVVGGGGGGGGGQNTQNAGGNGSAGGTTTFNAGGAGSVSVAGGFVGKGAGAGDNGFTGQAGFTSSNGGGGGSGVTARGNGNDGGGGSVSVSYLNLSGVSTVNVAIGQGGPGGGGASGATAGGAGGRGEVILEFVAA